MPKSRFSYAARNDSSNTAQASSSIYDLARDGFLQGILLNVSANLTSSTDTTLQVKDFIKNVQLINGSRTVFSLRGNELKAIEAYMYQSDIASTELNEGGTAGIDSFIIPLERWINGKLYAPDLSKWNHPQLLIQWDSSITKTDFGMFVDADTTPATTISLLQYIYDGTDKYTHGYCKTVNLKTITQAANQTTKITVSINEPLVSVMCTGGYGDTQFTDDHTQMTFDFGSGAWIALDLYANEMPKFQEWIFGNPFRCTFASDMKDKENLDCHMGKIIGFAACSAELVSNLSYILVSTAAAIPTIRIAGTTDQASTAYSRAKFNVTGFFPYHSFYLPMWALKGGSSDTVEPGEYHDLIITDVSGASPNTSSRPQWFAEYLVTKETG